MLDVLRKYLDSLTGITEMPRERAEKIVRELQDRGEIRARDLRKQAEKLVERSARNRRELIGLVQKEIGRQVKALGLATREDVERLEKRLKALERKQRSSRSKKTTKATGARKTTGSPQS